jgi:hypothetical protein
LPGRTISLLLLLLMAVACSLPAGGITLKQAYEAAPSLNGYDRWVELEAGATYTGGLMIGRVFSPVTNSFIMEEEGLDVRIVGNGAVLDLHGEQLCMSYCDKRLDIEDCVIINGNVRFRGDNDPGLALQPVGSVRYVTFYQPHDYGVRLQGSGAGILVERNIVVDAQDTGLDYIPTNGIAGTLIPTGTAIAASVQTGSYGVPDLRDNWTWHSDPEINVVPLHHFSFL